MATLTFTLRGDQIGRFDSLSGNGNGVERVVTLAGTRAIGSSREVYTVTVEQVGAGQTQFANGQFITITDQAGKVVVARTWVQPDIEQGLGGGDEHLILRANGLWCEIFYPGPHMVAALSPDLRADLARVLPLLGIDVRLAYGPPARPFRTVGQARRMAVAVPAG